MASTDDEKRETLYRMIGDIRVAMLTTVDENGALHSRPMETAQADDKGDLWFFTRATSPKADDVELDRHVNLAYAEPKSQDYVSITGIGSVLRDLAKLRELWSPAAKAWFPKGPDDPELALLRVQPVSGEYWDGPSSGVVIAFQYAKALVTGSQPKMGESAKIDLKTPAGKS